MGWKRRCQIYAKELAKFANARNCLKCIGQFLISEDIIQDEYYGHRHVELNVNIE